MGISIEYILFILGLLLLVSIIAGKTSFRLGIPTLLFFLFTGILAGSEGIGKIPFEDPRIAQFIGVFALNYILFSGGFDTSWKDVRPILGQGIILATLGVLITAVSVGAAVWYFTDFSFLEALLLGSIVSSTDAAAVFSILRSKSVRLKGFLKPTLELESGSNDPMAYFLTTSVIAIIQAPGTSIWTIFPSFLIQFAIGGVLGLAMGKITKLVINRIKLDFDGLYPVLLVAMVILTFSITEFLHGNGFLAVYICGLFLGNQELIHKKSLIKFFDGIAWLMQIILFLALGLLVFPSQMMALFIPGLLISAFMIIIARPLAVWISLSVFKVTNRERWFISWVGLRGAVPIVFATYPMLHGIEKAPEIFNLVFFITIVSVLVQGTSLPAVSKWMNLALPEGLKRRLPSDIELSDNVKSLIKEVDIIPDIPVVGKKIYEIGFPETALIVMIKREGNFLTPNGSTVIEPYDQLVILAETEESLSESLALVCPTALENKK